MDRDDFITYVLDFYNADNGIYKDVGATHAEVVDATRKLDRRYSVMGDLPCYDSIDREWVRDTILESR